MAKTKRKRNKNRMQIDGKYFYKEKMLGRGAYGKVFKVHDEDKNEFAVKKVAYNFKEGVYADIIKEMDFLRRFQAHPHVIELCGYKWDSQVFTVLMEYGGMPMHKFIDGFRTKYRMEKLPEVLWQILSTLGYVHHYNVCHRDIKPDNILIEEFVDNELPANKRIKTDDGVERSEEERDSLSHSFSSSGTITEDEDDYYSDDSVEKYKNIQIKVKLCDFGLSKSLLLRRNTPKTSTLWYRAPENLAQLKEYTTKIDIWALGCVIYEYCTDEVLFEGHATKDTLVKVLRTLGPITDRDYRKLNLDKMSISKRIRKYSMIPLIDKQLEKLMLRCLTINPDDRPTAIELMQDEYFTSKGYSIDSYYKSLKDVSIRDEFYVPRGLNELLKDTYTIESRRSVLDWIFDISSLEGNELKEHTIFLGIEIFDRVMQKWDKCIDQPNQFKYIAVGCLDIASKFLEVYSCDLELVYEYNNKLHYRVLREEYNQDPSKFDRRPQAPRITREDMKEFMIKVNKYEQKVLFLLDFVVLTSNPYIRLNGDFNKAKIEVYKRGI
jgi:serine/threonine protein kinase